MQLVHLSCISDNNNNVTYIAQIRKRSGKCATTCQRQTELFFLKVVSVMLIDHRSCGK